MAVIQLRFINGTGFVSNAIDWVTNSLWSHVEFITPDGYLGAHAGSGIQLRPLDYCRPTRERRYAIPCTEAQRESILADATKDIGMPYDLLDCVGLALHNRNLTSLNKEICSEWVYRKLWNQNILMLNCVEGFAHLITPEAIHLSPLLLNHCYYEA